MHEYLAISYSCLPLQIEGNCSADGKYSKIVFICDTFMRRTTQHFPSNTTIIPQFILKANLHLDDIEPIVSCIVTETLSSPKDRALVIVSIQLSELWTMKKFLHCYSLHHEPLLIPKFLSSTSIYEKFLFTKSAISKKYGKSIELIFSHVIPSNWALAWQVVLQKHIKIFKHNVISNSLSNDVLEQSTSFLTYCQNVNIWLDKHHLSRLPQQPIWRLLHWEDNVFWEDKCSLFKLPCLLDGHDLTNEAMSVITENIIQLCLKYQSQSQHNDTPQCGCSDHGIITLANDKTNLIQSGFSEPSNVHVHENKSFSKMVLIMDPKFVPLKEEWPRNSSLHPIMEPCCILKESELLVRLTSNYKQDDEILFLFNLSIRNLLEIRQLDDCQDHAALKYPYCKSGLRQSECQEHQLYNKMISLKASLLEHFTQSEVVILPVQCINFSIIYKNLCKKHIKQFDHKSKELSSADCATDQTQLLKICVESINSLIMRDNVTNHLGSFDIFDFLDFSMSLNTRKYIPDGMYPNKAGLGVLANILNDYIAKMNNKESQSIETRNIFQQQNVTEERNDESNSNVAEQCNSSESEQNKPSTNISSIADSMMALLSNVIESQDESKHIDTSDDCHQSDQVNHQHNCEEPLEQCPIDNDVASHIKHLNTNDTVMVCHGTPASEIGADDTTICEAFAPPPLPLIFSQLSPVNVASERNGELEGSVSLSDLSSSSSDDFSTLKWFSPASPTLPIIYSPVIDSALSFNNQIYPYAIPTSNGSQMCPSAVPVPFYNTSDSNAMFPNIPLVPVGNGPGFNMSAVSAGNQLLPAMAPQDASKPQATGNYGDILPQYTSRHNHMFQLHAYGGVTHHHTQPLSFANSLNGIHTSLTQPPVQQSNTSTYPYSRRDDPSAVTSHEPLSERRRLSHRNPPHDDCSDLIDVASHRLPSNRRRSSHYIPPSSNSRPTSSHSPPLSPYSSRYYSRRRSSSSSNQRTATPNDQVHHYSFRHSKSPNSVRCSDALGRCSPLNSRQTSERRLHRSNKMSSSKRRFNPVDHHRHKRGRSRDSEYDGTEGHHRHKKRRHKSRSSRHNHSRKPEIYVISDDITESDEQELPTPTDSRVQSQICQTSASIGLVQPQPDISATARQAPQQSELLASATRAVHQAAPPAKGSVIDTNSKKTNTLEEREMIVPVECLTNSSSTNIVYSRTDANNDQFHQIQPINKYHSRKTNLSIQTERYLSKFMKHVDSSKIVLPFMKETVTVSGKINETRTANQSESRINSTGVNHESPSIGKVDSNRPSEPRRIIDNLEEFYKPKRSNEPVSINSQKVIQYTMQTCVQSEPITNYPSQFLNPIVCLNNAKNKPFTNLHIHDTTNDESVCPSSSLPSSAPVEGVTGPKDVRNYLYPIQVSVQSAALAVTTNPKLEKKSSSVDSSFPGIEDGSSNSGDERRGAVDASQGSAAADESSSPTGGEGDAPGTKDKYDPLEINLDDLP